MRELVQKDIDGRSYEFQQFNTTTALKILSSLTKILGEPMALALGAYVRESPQVAGGIEQGNGKQKVKVDTDVLAKAVHSLIERLDEDEVVRLVKKLTSENVLCDHAKIIFDDHFCGELPHLFKVLVAALEVQYGNFTDAITAMLPKAKMASQGIGVR